MLTHVEMVTRIAVGAALGGVIGYERDRHGRPVGLRTHFIVALTAATFMVISSQFVYLQRYAPSDLVEVDASRIAASVVSAVGFLAGGTILRVGLTVQGLTTAAGIWLVTAIGMSAGAGMFVESLAVTVLGLLALTLLRRFEDKRDNVLNRRVTVSVRPGLETLGLVLRELRAVCLEVSDVEYEQRFTDVALLVMSFEVVLGQDSGVAGVLARLEAIPGIERVQVQRV
ncbi:MAG TPA: MgtC/SapB family protein [Polyangiaceae bacterium]|nr:MgtC/SapB family protein [Polyangiaceae bacterium]